jgi:hydroxymethylglutaryl-CoA synthase
MSRPQNVGIKGFEIYFPKRCISQDDLEDFDGAAKGKYTIGFGQKLMACTDDREDVNSFALTVVNNLMEKYQIDPKSIGRLEVGTETIIDKSKSVKSVLMNLFASSGNSDIEGLDSKNACYGGTAGLFNAINWIESSSWDGRDAIVVACDIAIYAAGPARPVGGAGAIAFLIGPDAPITFDPVHGTHMANEWDFYKPDLSSEYPTVDGPRTLITYLGSLDNCYDAFRTKTAKFAAKGSSASVNGDAHKAVKLDDFDYTILHSPYSKLVQKGFGRFLYNDFLSDPQNENYKDIPQEWTKIDRLDTIYNKDVEKAFAALAKSRMQTKLEPTMEVVRNVGNMYTASVYGGLASLLSNVESANLQGKRILVYSFGSGSAASVFSLRVKGDVTNLSKQLDLKQRLAAREVVPCQTYVDCLNTREQTHNAVNYEPKGKLSDLFPGTYYLEKVDGQFRRTYGRTATA